MFLLGSNLNIFQFLFSGGTNFWGGEGIKILVGGESIRGGIFPGQWGEEISKRLAGGREPSRENPCQYASFMYRISLCENANSTCGEIQTPP